MSYNENTLTKRFIYLVLIGLCLISTPLLALETLRFGDFFVHPVGPRGLEPTVRLLSLHGQRMVLSGYLMLRAGEPALLVPHPVVLGHEDEGQADDLPGTTVFLHGPLPLQVRHGQQLCLSGVLQIGPMEEGDGRRSFVRLILSDSGAQF